MSSKSERPGFEPGVRFEAYNGLANRSMSSATRNYATFSHLLSVGLSRHCAYSSRNAGRYAILGKSLGVQTATSSQVAG